MGNSSTTITVNTQGGDVVVRKLALGDYAALLRALKKLPTEVGKFIQGNSAEDLKDSDVLFAQIPGMIAEAIPEFAEVLAIVSDKDKQFYLEGDLADAIEVLGAALQLNDYTRVMNNVKKITGQKPAA